jgi:DNA-binding MarR family transcriptional regulator
MTTRFGMAFAGVQVLVLLASTGAAGAADSSDGEDWGVLDLCRDGFKTGNHNGTWIEDGGLTLAQVIDSSGQGSIWTNITQELSPHPRREHSMVFDEKAGEIVLFGGEYMYQLDQGGGPFIRSRYLNDTWTFNLTTETWKEMNPPTTPSARARSSMAYDNANDLVILTGGENWDRLPDQTWTYNLSTDEWKLLDAPTPPMNVPFHPLVYDRDCGVSVMFRYPNETWVFNASAAAWTNMSPGASPPVLDDCLLAYDSDDDLVVLLGNVTVGGIATSVTWTYDFKANSWAGKKPVSSPSFWASQMIYDRQNDAVLLFGGFADTYNETWTYDISDDVWTEIEPESSPPGRYGHSMACDGANGVTVLFGGSSNDMFGDLNDTWACKSPVPAAAGNMSSGYRASGVFTSCPISAGEIASYGTLDWDGPVPAGTSVRLQLRTASTGDDLRAAGFTGPDGTPASFYTRSGQRIDGAPQGTGWIQYRAFLDTSAPDRTPAVRNVTVTFLARQGPALKRETPGPNLATGAAAAGIITLVIGGYLVWATETGKLGMLRLVLPLYTRLKRKDVMYNETRGMLRGAIALEPGIHYSELIRRLGIPNGEAAYHLQTLERENLVKSRSDGRHRRFYPAGMKIGDLPVKLNRLQTAIFDTLREREGLSKSELSRTLEIPLTTIQRQVGRMAAMGALRLERKGLSVRCYIAEGWKGTGFPKCTVGNVLPAATDG